MAETLMDGLLSEIERCSKVYECIRCGISCREKEDTGEREMWH